MRKPRKSGNYSSLGIVMAAALAALGCHRPTADYPVCMAGSQRKSCSQPQTARATCWAQGRSDDHTETRQRGAECGVPRWNLHRLPEAAALTGTASLRRLPCRVLGGADPAGVMRPASVAQSHETGLPVHPTFGTARSVSAWRTAPARCQTDWRVGVSPRPLRGS